jgi:hypothetical protein
LYEVLRVETKEHFPLFDKQMKTSSLVCEV